MPKPKKGESRKGFLARCIPDLIRNENRPQNQAVAICQSFFDKNKARTDATNYLLSSLDKNCTNCIFARPGLFCSLFDFYFDIGFICDAWRSVPSSKEVCMADIELAVELDGTEKVSQQMDNLTDKAGKLAESVEKVDKELGDFADRISGSAGNENNIGSDTGSAATEKDMYLDSGMPVEIPIRMKATSFGELDSLRQVAISADIVRETADTFAMLARNIMASNIVEDKEGALVTLANEFTSRVNNAMNTKEKWQPLTDYVANFIADHSKQKLFKTEGGTKYPKKDYAFTPSDQPSTWKLRMSENRPGNITIKQLGRAAAAFSSGGFRGQKVQIPGNKVAGVKRKLRGAYQELGVKRKEMPDSIKEISNGMTIWKEKDGIYRFVAVYSNNFRDDDSPPDIISEKSHQRFDDLLNKGVAPYPELWLWHRPEWRCGNVTGHAWDDSGFAVAIGQFDKGVDEIAEWIAKEGENIAVSHGMPNDTVKRSNDDTSIIIEHITREVSPLPAWSAANKLTGFLVIDKEVDRSMAILDEKRKALIAQGLSESVLSTLEAANAEKAKEASASGVESKEAEAVEQVETDKDKTVGAVGPTGHAGPGGTAKTVEEKVSTEDVKQADEQKEDPITRDEIAQALLESQKPIIEAIATLADELGKTRKELAYVQKTESEKVAEKAANTPASSLVDMIRAASAINSPGTEVKEGDKLLSGGPEEKQTQKVPRVSAIPFINELLGKQLQQ